MADTEKGFDLMHPPLRVSNPGGTKAFQEFPKHLHRADGTFCEVGTAAAQAAQIADGWFLTREQAILAAPGDQPAEPVKRGPGRPPRVSDAA